MRFTAKPFFPAACLLLAATSAPAQSTAAKPATHSTATRTAASSTALPKNIPPVRGVPRTLYTISLRYIDIKVGTGLLAVPGKMYTVNYTGWLRSTGVEFDSSIPDKEHPQRKPITFPGGVGAVIPGFDTAFQGMRVGGKRRVFIPALLAYANHGTPTPPGRVQVVPPKADLVFDIELISMTDPPKPQLRPAMPQSGGRPFTPAAPGYPPKPSSPSAPSAPGAPAAPQTSTTPTSPSAPGSPATAPATTPPHPE